MWWEEKYICALGCSKSTLSHLWKTSPDATLQCGNWVVSSNTSSACTNQTCPNIPVLSVPPLIQHKWTETFLCRVTIQLRKYLVVKTHPVKSILTDLKSEVSHELHPTHPSKSWKHNSTKTKQVFDSSFSKWWVHWYPGAVLVVRTRQNRRWVAGISAAQTRLAPGMVINKSSKLIESTPLHVVLFCLMSGWKEGQNCPCHMSGFVVNLPSPSKWIKNAFYFLDYKYIIK